MAEEPPQKDAADATAAYMQLGATIIEVLGQAEKLTPTWRVIWNRIGGLWIANDFSGVLAELKRVDAQIRACEPVTLPPMHS